MFSSMLDFAVKVENSAGLPYLSIRPRALLYRQRTEYRSKRYDSHFLLFRNSLLDITFIKSVSANMRLLIPDYLGKP